MTMYVITHKENDYKLPQGYKNVLVGANKGHLGLSSGYLFDDEDENISKKNANYSELTGMFWLYKHQKDAHVGISHYRRYFLNSSSKSQKLLEILLFNQLKPIKVSTLDRYLKDYDWIMARKVKIGGGENVYQAYVNAHYEKDLKTTKQVIKQIYPQYLNAFEETFNQTSFSLFNMCYTSKQEFDTYCKWLFDVLFEVEKRTDLTGYDNYQRRIYGFLAERLFNVYMNYHKDKTVKYLEYFDTRRSTRKTMLEYIGSRFFKRNN